MDAPPEFAKLSFMPDGHANYFPQVGPLHVVRPDRISPPRKRNTAAID
jgi:hypothetical protein